MRNIFELVFTFIMAFGFMNWFGTMNGLALSCAVILIANQIREKI